MATIKKEQLQTIDLDGTIQAVSFGVNGRAFKIKNWSDDNIFVSFDSNVTPGRSFRIASMMEDILCINVDDSSDISGRGKVYVLGAGTGKVQVQAIWF